MFMEKFRSDHVKDNEGLNQHMKNVFAGSLSSALARAIGHPLDILKVRFQLQKLDELVFYTTMPHAIKHIYSTEGIAGFWRGHYFSQFTGFFQGVIQFWTFEQIQAFLKLTPLGRTPRLCNFSAGYLTGTIVVLAVNPMDMIRTHLMIAQVNDKQLSLYKNVQQIFATGGIKNFYSGTKISSLHVGTLYGGKFMFYNIFCDINLHVSGIETREELPTYLLIASGAAAGFLGTLISYPMDLIKRRLQAHAVETSPQAHKSLCRAIVQCACAVNKYEGFLGLYKGLIPCVLKSAVSTAIQFSTFDKVRNWVDDFL